MPPRPKPITINRHAPPESHRLAWSAEPWVNPLIGLVTGEEKARARAELERAIAAAGYSAQQCEITWCMVDVSWGWTARVRESG